MLAQAFRLTKNAHGSVSTLIFNFPAWEENFSQSIYKKMNEESNRRGGRSTMKNSFFSGKFEEGTSYATSYAIVIIYSYKGQLRWENPQTGDKKVRDHTFSSKTRPNGEKRLFEMLGRVESTSLRQICEGHRWRGLSAQRTAMDRPSTRTRRLRGSFVTNGNQADFAVKEWKRHGPNRAVTAPEELHQKILSGDHQQSASVDCVFL